MKYTFNLVDSFHIKEKEEFLVYLNVECKQKRETFFIKMDLYSGKVKDIKHFGRLVLELSLSIEERKAFYQELGEYVKKNHFNIILTGVEQPYE
ncbi:hypothetical protein SAMN05192533_102304 [Mesobacillus persicus]|uniref:Uncharacterized protein n=1 Tax=Mesobacillus persicus TaxID=930146 RepID=A0A1H7XPL2_9BACI|nr:hypothetical protein [Mesobacillus persicus]SEM35681.1 hypothetical protein SAMN05192533_102304 [Mesobacillus persicus]